MQASFREKLENQQPGRRLEKKMKAAVLTKVKEITVQEAETPKPGPDDVLIRVMACGLCPADYRVYSGEAMWRKPPAILGHELAGTVEAVGSNVSRFKVGDRVAAEASDRCGYCKPCVSGSENLCLNRRAVGEGGLAQYAVARANWTRSFSKASFEEASFTEPLACVVNGARRSGIRVGVSFAVIGSGQIGLMQMQVAKLMGAKTIMIDLKEDRLGLASKLGADYTVDSSAVEPAARVKEITGGYGADRVTVAVSSSKAIEQGFALLGKMGILNIFASSYPSQITIDANLIHYGELTVTGTYDKTRADFETAASLIESRKVDVKSLISHRLNLDDTWEGFRLMERGAGMKIMVIPN
jgi:L-iditol 2-dehydrogenase